MKNIKNDLMAIYGHENLLFNLGEGKDLLAYYIHLFYNVDGVLNAPEFIQFVFDHAMTDEQKKIYSSSLLFGPFHAFSELEVFCLKAASYFKKDAVSLISVGEFNEAAMEAGSKDALFELLNAQASRLERQQDESRKGFLTNFFN